MDESEDDENGEERLKAHRIDYPEHETQYNETKMMVTHCIERDCCEKLVSYEIKQALGQGQFGTVYKCSHTPDDIIDPRAQDVLENVKSLFTTKGNMRTLILMFGLSTEKDDDTLDLITKFQAGQRIDISDVKNLLDKLETNSTLSPEIALLRTKLFDIYSPIAEMYNTDPNSLASVPQKCTQYALKIQSSDYEWKNEIWALQLLNKANFRAVPKLIDYWQCGRQYFLVMDLIIGKRLKDFDRAKLVVPPMKNKIIELVKNLEEMNRLGVFHNDVHGGNYMWDENKQRFMIIDFGLSSAKPRNGGPDAEIIFSPMFALGWRDFNEIKKEVEELNV